MNEIKTTLKFKDYCFSRVKPTNQGVAYAPAEWCGKKVTVTPLPYTISEKVIEKQYKVDDGYELSIPTTTILTKTIKKGANIGYVYLPKEWIGLDVLMIETPNYKDLYWYTSHHHFILFFYHILILMQRSTD